MGCVLDHILVIDDDVDMCRMLAEYLQPEGFKVEAVYDGEQGLTRALSGAHSLIVLDVILPGMNGIELLRRLRTESNARVLLLSARGEEIDRIVGLEVGADDYLPKPFSPRELLARVRAILRRPVVDPSSASRKPERLVIGDLEMNTGDRSVKRNGKYMELTAMEFNILEFLLRAAGHVVTRDQVASLVLGRQLSAVDRSIDVHISKLRRKLGTFPTGEERIKSVHSVGYLYAAP